MNTAIHRVVIALLFCGLALPAHAEPRSYRLKDVDLHSRIIWGATCEAPDGTGLSFGGQDQQADDGLSHTRLLEKGEWKDIHLDLQSRNKWQSQCEDCRKLAARQKDLVAAARRLIFRGLPRGDEFFRAQAELLAKRDKVLGDTAALIDNKLDIPIPMNSFRVDQDMQAIQQLNKAVRLIRDKSPGVADTITPDEIKRMRSVQILLEQAADHLASEPPPRALSPIVYEPQSKCYLLFGGDHLDYLTNDTWLFDPALKSWRRLDDWSAPAPRANHSLKAIGDGKIELTGGYTYTSTTDYMGGQYRDIDDGPWVLDLKTNTWSAAANAPADATNRLSSSDARVYRTGPFLPEFFLQGPPPDAAAFGNWLTALPANQWTQTKPPQLPQMNRDWGSAIIDPEHDLILRWSGGHCAHGGSDVLQFHLATNRWELPFPVEFPLGQLYTNTSYPEGFNFNRRPWITGHSYQSYGYEPTLQKMIFVGQSSHSYVYDPMVSDWTERHSKPAGMAYNSCYYTLTLCTTPHGLFAWTQQGDLFRFDPKQNAWLPVEQHGGKLPGSVVDNSTLVYDAKRDRLLFARKGYGDGHQYDGQLHAFSLKTGEVSQLSPAGMAAASAISYLCQIRYDVEHDLLLVGATLPPDSGGPRRTPAYDCAGNRWVSLAIGGDDPNGKNGRNVSLGLMYDNKRHLFWAVDAASKVFVLRLDPAQADLKPLP